MEKSVGEVSVRQRYDQLMGSLRFLRFTNVEALDINHYVVSQALGGLF